ncbi:MAG: hypothetical protein IPM25_16690 [Chloracidobacterium sp.]|nr:hypothetical protein [Chloracidobacterium sp.]
MRSKVIASLAFCLLAVTVKGQSVDAILANARSLQAARKFVEAAAEMDRALATDPKNTRYLFEQAQYYDLARNEAAALKNVELAIELEPDNEATVMEGIRRLFRAGSPIRCQRTLDVATAFLVVNPGSDKAYSWIFHAKQCLKDDPGALAAINKAIEINPSYPLYHSNRANLISRIGDTKLAVELLAEMIAILETQIPKTENPNDQAALKRELGIALMQLSLVHERTGERTLAIEALTRAIPLDHDLYLQKRAVLHSRIGMYKEALTDIEQVIASKAETARLRGLTLETVFNASLIRDRAEIHFNAGEYKRSLADFQECVRRDPVNKALYQKRIDEIILKLQEVS